MSNNNNGGHIRRTAVIVLRTFTVNKFYKDVNVWNHLIIKIMPRLEFTLSKRFESNASMLPTLNIFFIDMYTWTDTIMIKSDILERLTCGQ